MHSILNGYDDQATLAIMKTLVNAPTIGPKAFNGNVIINGNLVVSGIITSATTPVIADETQMVTTVATSVIASITKIVDNYTMLLTDYYIGCSLLGKSVTLTLPLGASSGKMYIVKDEVGSALMNPIAVTSPSLIDGSATVRMNVNYQVMKFLWTGTTWSIV